MLHVENVSLVCSHCLRAGPNHPSLLLNTRKRENVVCLGGSIERGPAAIFHQARVSSDKESSQSSDRFQRSNGAPCQGTLLLGSFSYVSYGNEWHRKLSLSHSLGIVATPKAEMWEDSFRGSYGKVGTCQSKFFIAFWVAHSPFWWG